MQQTHETKQEVETQFMVQLFAKLCIIDSYVGIHIFVA